MRPTIRRGAALVALLTIVGAAPALADEAKPASPATIAALPTDDGEDADFAQRGFVAIR